MKLKREHNVMLAQEREDRRRIRELTTMSTDIENSSIMSNSKDCRPPEFNNNNQSLFTNSVIQESTLSKGGKNKKSNLGGGAQIGTGGDQNMLTINKTQQERELARRKLHDVHNQHLSKVQARKHTIS